MNRLSASPDIANPELQAGAPHMWLAKLYYFLFYAAIGAMAPFFNIFLQQRGLTGAEIGLLGSIPPLIVLVSGPFWAGIADRTRRHQLILALGVFVAGMLSFPYLWVTGFWPLAVLVMVYSFFRAPVPPLLDSAVLSMTKRTGANYGRQRLFGSLGYVVSTYGVGLVLTASNLSLFFVIHALLLLLGCTVLSFFLPVETMSEPVDLLAGLRRLARRRGYMSFLVMNVLQGIGSAAFFGFLGLRLMAIGATEQQVGLAFALAALAEIPSMAMGGWVQAHFRLSQMIVFGLLGVGAAYLLIGLATTPFLVVAVTPFIGIFYGAYLMGGVGYASETAPPGLRATGQSLMAAAQFGLGWAIGSLVAGLIWGSLGGGWVFLLAAVALFTGAAVFAVGQRGDRVSV